MAPTAYRLKSVKPSLTQVLQASCDQPVYLACGPPTHCMLQSCHALPQLPLLRTHAAWLFLNPPHCSGTLALVLAFAAPCLASYPLSVLGDGPPTIMVGPLFCKVTLTRSLSLTLSMVAVGPFGPPQVLVLASLNTMEFLCLHVYNFSIVGN